MRPENRPSGGIGRICDHRIRMDEDALRKIQARQNAESKAKPTLVQRAKRHLGGLGRRRPPEN